MVDLLTTTFVFELNVNKIKTQRQRLSNWILKSQIYHLYQCHSKYMELDMLKIKE